MFGGVYSNVQNWVDGLNKGIFGILTTCTHSWYCCGAKWCLMDMEVGRTDSHNVKVLDKSFPTSPHLPSLDKCAQRYSLEEFGKGSVS